MVIWPKPPKPGERILVTCATRTGKSYYIWHSIFVPWQGLRIWVDSKNVDRYMVAPVYHNLHDIKEKPTDTILLRPEIGTTKPEFWAAWDEISEYLVNLKREEPEEPILLVIDEAQEVMTKGKVRDSVAVWIDTMAGANASVVIINPDHSTIPRHIFHQTTHFIMFDGHEVIVRYCEERLSTIIPQAARDGANIKFGGARFDWERWFIIRPDGSEVPVEVHEDGSSSETSGGTELDRHGSDEEEPGRIDEDRDRGDADANSDEGRGGDSEGTSRREIEAAPTSKKRDRFEELKL